MNQEGGKRMGRPRLFPALQKERVAVPVTLEEKVEIFKAAQAQGLCMGRWGRKALLAALEKEEQH